MLSTDNFMSHFTQVDPSYQRNQQRRRFAKSARHHAGLESRLQNQAAATEMPPQHPVEDPDENSGAESSSSPASPPVVCSQYQLWTTLRVGHRSSTRTPTQLLTPAASARPLIWLIQQTSWTYKALCSCNQASLLCWRGTFHCPTQLATTLLETRSSHFWIKAEKEKKKQLVKLKDAALALSQQQFEDLFNSLVGWWLWFGLICFKIYITNWSCKGSSPMTLG